MGCTFFDSKENFLSNYFLLFGISLIIHFFDFVSTVLVLGLRLPNGNVVLESNLIVAPMFADSLLLSFVRVYGFTLGALSVVFVCLLMVVLLSGNRLLLRRVVLGLLLLDLLVTSCVVVNNLSFLVYW